LCFFYSSLMGADALFCAIHVRYGILARVEFALFEM
jgi:hypothetical protein